MIKFKLSMRSLIIGLFVILYAGSMIVLNQFFTKMQREEERIINNITFNNDLNDIVFNTPEDQELIGNLSKKLNQSMAGLKMLQNETKIYSSLLLLTIMILSIFVFIFIFYVITKPINDLQAATNKIKKGDFNVYLPPKGMTEIKSLIYSFNDMSRELENIQQKLLVAQKEMIWKDLSRILTHEIKNPLTPIQLTLQRLEEKYENDPAKFNEIFHESLDIIYQEVGNLQNLVQSFSAFAKDTPPNPTIFDPAKAIIDILKPYQNDYQLEFDLLENKRIKFDQTHFYQILTNVSQNAIESTNESGRIWVSLKKSHSFLVLSIRDEGKGIDSKDLPRIFEPYFTNKAKGTGLGLALVKRLCDANHTNIRVKSAVGKGTEIEIILEEILENNDN
ncbi:MAG TPA: ATP-binding protein [Candidatus Cloacimonadota bacterium]|jgi:two-component system nitrogen regulation sensor histidine kinase NtrY|nr:ATP-binding protein [Candidatus Cloacimonadales bacterium]HPY96622.1 ATP-binding protein [Candidatus Cloacimonadota bacterium]HQB40951.1 ATP-binding protein [Candidatus Cloacimonadota bacterium]